MSTTEHTINDAIAEVLRDTRRSWSDPKVVSSENTGTLLKNAGRPDILVTEQNVSPVSIETEVLPATTVEAEAIARLGQQVKSTGRTILSAIAVRLPVRLRKLSSKALRADIEKADDLQTVLYTGSTPESAVRWPKSGWLSGGVGDLSILAQAASVPPDVIDVAAANLIHGVAAAAGLLHEVSQEHPRTVETISEEIKQEDSVQTRQMAATILANAFVFQETLAGGPGKLGAVRSLEELKGSNELTKSNVLEQWRKILEVNYWPIFDIARRILEPIPAAESGPIIDLMAHTADKLLQNRLMRSHDLTGAVFQKVIRDRKFLAAFYTTPASASLLIGLAISAERTPAGGKWSSADDVKKLRIVDFACGTGTLLSTAYQRVGQLHELAGGDAEAIHSEMMATAIVGCDVLPAAAHLTASMLSGAHPTANYRQSSILTVAYGRQPDKTIALGSLDLMDPQRKFGILEITAKAMEGMGEAERDTWEHLPHASFDLVVMNPPFTRATGHEGKKVGIPVPMFAAFGSTDKEQRLMSEATQNLTEGTSAHGNAGEASIFLVLADRKLKKEGTLALVMPLSLMSGDAWEDSRQLLAKKYSNLIVVSIAGSEGGEVSFSADTHMGECLVVASKSGKSTRALFVTLEQTPAYPLLGQTAASQITALIGSKSLRRLEDGPIGGTPLTFGDEKVGEVVDAPLPKTGGWNLARVLDFALAQTAYQLSQGKVWLPSQVSGQARMIHISTIGKIGSIGPYHMDINASDSKGGLRGPFKVVPTKGGAAPTYPVLWAHQAKRETTLAFEGDSEGVPLKSALPSRQEAIDEKVAAIWASASHSHFNRDFRFNSQPTSMQFTPRKTIGGRAWLSISLASVDQEKTVVAWANTTLGLLLYWAHANRQQAGRGSIGKESLASLPVLDIPKLTANQLKAGAKVFDDMKGKSLLPFHEIATDTARAELDARFGVDVLGLASTNFDAGGPMDLIRRKLANEPSVRGQKE